MASVQRLFACPCGLWVSPLRRILRFKCGEPEQAQLTNHRMCPDLGRKRPRRETLVGGRYESKAVLNGQHFVGRYGPTGRMRWEQLPALFDHLVSQRQQV